MRSSAPNRSRRDACDPNGTIILKDRPDLCGVYLFVRDMAAMLDFYRTLGLTIEEISPVFARADAERLHDRVGAAALTCRYDPNPDEPSGEPATNTINVRLASADTVDATCEV